MNVSHGIARRLRQVLESAVALRTSSGSFRAEGVRFSHPGVLLNQEVAADVVRAALVDLGKAGHDQAAARAMLARTTVRVVRDQPLLGGIPVEQFCRWTGGFRDRGEIVLCHAEDWPERLASLLRSLLLHELAPQSRAPRRRVF